MASASSSRMPTMASVSSVGHVSSSLDVKRWNCAKVDLAAGRNDHEAVVPGATDECVDQRRRAGDLLVGQVEAGGAGAPEVAVGRQVVAAGVDQREARVVGRAAVA